MEFIISFFKKVFFFASCLLILSSCSSNQIAPVEELRPQYAMSHNETSYIVKPGDTLYAIAFLYDLNAAELARFNHISYPYYLNSGQTIRLINTKHDYFTSSPPKEGLRHKWYTRSTSSWMLPTKGQLAPRNYNNPIDLKGITILGQPRQNIVASGNGVVAYAGNGLPGYGNLILIKHPNDFLTAYAFNSSILVKEGQSVRVGQQIATMGQLDSGRWGLHFEIRNHGRAVNPKQYLSIN